MPSSSQDDNLQLDLSSLPPIFVSGTHFDDMELFHLEEELEATKANLTYKAAEAEIFLTKANGKRRIMFDLRSVGLFIEEVPQSSVADAKANATTDQSDVRAKSQENAVQRIDSGAIVIDDGNTTTIQPGHPERSTKTVVASLKRTRSTMNDTSSDRNESAKKIRAVRLDWFHESKKAGCILPLDGFTSFVGKSITERRNTSQHPVNNQSSAIKKQSTTSSNTNTAIVHQSILERAKEDAGQAPASQERSFKRRFDGKSSKEASNNISWAPGSKAVQYAHLLHATTSEEDCGFSNDLPEPPEWITAGTKYACQRVTKAGSPNEEFISLLRKIKLSRILTSDEIGVRAYSTSIAALLAYPYKLISPKEIMRMPGCDAKIANLYVEFANTGKIKAVDDLEADHDLSILRLFYDIWGVGSLTAREFYYDHGWKDLDDLVEYNWSGLSRVQQIGVKYYEEFLEKIPRAEVEEIGEIVHRHAVIVRDADIQSMIVGGYRRGKDASGDVDIIVSHPDESKTLNIISDIISSLEEEGWVTHTLLISLNSTNRDQQTLPYRSGHGHGGHGFDTLDKALVVWQDPNWPSKAEDLANNPKFKNPNIHRRVDIIIAPWRTVGCAVLGWSGGTTFQRDVRRYVKHRYGWKFDSSGGRDRGNGQVLDLEGYHRYDGEIGTGRAKTMLQAEQRVFESLGLEYREPSERVTD